MSVVARIYFLRHAETDANREGIIQGHLDTVLNDVGIHQAKLTATALQDVPFEAAFSSDLKRAARTAEIILEKHADVQLQCTEQLRERRLGDWQGVKIELRGAPPPNMESIAAFLEHSMRWWDALVAQFAAPGTGTGASPRCVLVVTHGGVVAKLIKALVECGKVRVACVPSVEIGHCPNVSVSVVEVDAEGGQALVRYGDTAHLDVEAVAVNADVDATDTESG